MKTPTVSRHCLLFFLPGMPMLGVSGGTLIGQEGGRMAAAFEGLVSSDESIRNSTIVAVAEDRQSVIDKLIPLVDPENSGKYSEDTRCAAAHLLGRLRAIEGIPVLSKALADPPGHKVSSNINHCNLPVFSALVNIGRPAVPAMIENIRTTDDTVLRNNSLDVLSHILGGKRRLLELLAKLNDQAIAKGPEGSRVAARIREASSHVESHYREDEEPLY